MSASRKQDLAPAPILRGAIYPKAALQQIVGWGNSAYAAAQKAGLRTTVVNGRALISGDDFIDYVERVAREKREASL